MTSAGCWRAMDAEAVLQDRLGVADRDDDRDVSRGRSAGRRRASRRSAAPADGVVVGSGMCSSAMLRCVWVRGRGDAARTGRPPRWDSRYTILEAPGGEDRAAECLPLGRRGAQDHLGECLLAARDDEVCLLGLRGEVRHQRVQPAVVGVVPDGAVAVVVVAGRLPGQVARDADEHGTGRRDRRTAPSRRRPRRG